jgi:hypothetical protein
MIWIRPDPDELPGSFKWRGSSISRKFESGSRVLMIKNGKKYKNTKNKNRFKIAIYLSLGLRKERPSYRRSLKPPKENIQRFKN